MTRLIRRLTCSKAPFAALLLGAGSLASAQIKESGDNVVDKYAEGSLRLLEELRPKVLADVKSGKSACIIVSAGGGFTTVTIASSSKADPIWFAEALKKCFDGVPIEWSKQGEASAARVNVSRSRIGVQSSSYTVYLAPARSYLTEAGVSPVVVIRAPLHVELTVPGHDVDKKTRTSQYVVVDGAEPLPVIGVRATLGAWPLLAAFLIFAAPALVTGLGFFIAVQAAKNKRIPLADRKKRFQTVAKVSALGPVAGALPFAAYALVTRQMAPITDLWFGTYSSAPLIPLSVLPLLIVVALIPAFSKVERRLMNDCEPDSSGAKRVQRDPLK